MNETKVQIGEDVLLDIGVHSDWYISSIGYNGKSVAVTLCRKADQNKEWWLADALQIWKNCDNCGTKTEACYFCNPMRSMWTLPHTERESK